MRVDPRFPLLLACGLVSLGMYCNPSPGDTALDTGALTTGSGGTTATTPAPPGFDGTITGTVRVVPYDLDEDGEIVKLDTDVWGGVWPYGAVWVFAFRTDEKTGHESYYAQQTFLSPTIGGDAYALTFDTDDTDTVYVGAQLDDDGDRILGTGDPVGIYPAPITIVDGSTFSGADIEILVYYDADGSGGGGGGCCGDGGGTSDCLGEPGGNGDGTTSVSGDIVITEAYGAGEAAAMIMSTANEGPYASTIVQPQAVGGGGEAPYTVAGCAGWGEMNLVGCWDHNLNLIFDAADKCGPYISAPDVDGNPITLAGSNLVGHDIQIPFGDYGLELVPFVRLEGSIVASVGDFGNYPKGSTVWVAALKYRPEGGFPSADLENLENTYDVQSWPVSEVAGQKELTYRLDVPGRTIVYLWAYVDEDGDGLVNESGEPVASGGDNVSGRITTGETSSTWNLLLAPDDD